MQHFKAQLHYELKAWRARTPFRGRRRAPGAAPPPVIRPDKSHSRHTRGTTSAANLPDAPLSAPPPQAGAGRVGGRVEMRSPCARRTFVADRWRRYSGMKRVCLASEKGGMRCPAGQARGLKAVPPYACSPRRTPQTALTLSPPCKSYDFERSHPNPHRRAPQPVAEARAAYGPTLETYRRAEGRSMAAGAAGAALVELAGHRAASCLHRYCVSRRSSNGSAGKIYRCAIPTRFRTFRLRPAVFSLTVLHEYFAATSSGFP